MLRMLRTTLGFALFLAPSLALASQDEGDLQPKALEAPYAEGIGLRDLTGDALSLIVSHPAMDSKGAQSLMISCKAIFAKKHKIHENKSLKLYQALGQDISKAFFHFDFALWNLEDRMPLSVKKVIHDWYLFGGVAFQQGVRTIADPYRRYCYLMAAARAGHRYAAIEAGQMLIDGIPSADLKEEYEDAKARAVIPSLLTLDDIAAVVPEYANPEVRAWDLSSLASPVLTDPELQAFMARAEEILPGDTGYFYSMYEKAENVEDVKNNYERLIQNIAAQYDLLIGELQQSQKAKTAEYKIYIELLKLKRDNLDLYFLRSLIPVFSNRLIGDIDEGLNEMQRVFEENFAKYTPGLLTYWEEKLKKLDLVHNHKWGSHRLEYLDVPFYWHYMKEYYGLADNNAAYEDSQRHLLSLLLDPAAVKDLALALYDGAPADGDDLKTLEDVTAKCHQLFIMSGLLGDEDPASLWGDREEAYLPQMLQLAGENEAIRAKVCELFREALPMKAFILHLALLRNPEHQNTLTRAKLFYGEAVPGKDATEVVNIYRNIELHKVWLELLNAQEAITAR